MHKQHFSRFLQSALSSQPDADQINLPLKSQPYFIEEKHGVVVVVREVGEGGGDKHCTDLKMCHMLTLN